MSARLGSSFAGLCVNDKRAVAKPPSPDKRVRGLVGVFSTVGQMEMSESRTVGGHARVWPSVHREAGVPTESR